MDSTVTMLLGLWLAGTLVVFAYVVSYTGRVLDAIVFGLGWPVLACLLPIEFAARAGRRRRRTEQAYRDFSRELAQWDKERREHQRSAAELAKKHKEDS